MPTLDASCPIHRRANGTQVGTGDLGCLPARGKGGPVIPAAGSQ